MHQNRVNLLRSLTLAAILAMACSDLVVARNASAATVWTWSFGAPPATISPTDKIYIPATITNSASSTGSISFNEFGFGATLFCNGSACNGSSGGYWFNFGQDEAFPWTTFVNHFHAITLAPGESAAFIFATITPVNGSVNPGVYTADIQISEGPFGGWTIHRATNTFSWTIVNNTACELPVTRLSQGDPKWAPDLYDHSPIFTIGAKGCALTSLSMALTFAGINTNPGSLNQIMNANPGDYNGLAVSWNDATRDASGAALLKFHPTRLSGQAGLQYLDAQVCQQGHPVIVGVELAADGTPGHFVIVTGKVGPTFQIADPGYSDRTKLDDYRNTFETRGFVADPPGDISALDIGISDGADFLVTDPAGNRNGVDPVTGQITEEIPDAAYFRDALSDDVTGDRPTEVARTSIISQPIPGTYQLLVIGTKLGVYALSIRGFSQDGSPQLPVAMTGIAGAGSVTAVSVQFDPTGGTSPVAERIATFRDTLADVDNAARLGLIDNRGIATSLSQKVMSAQRAKAPARNQILRAFIAEINALVGTHINATAAGVLLGDANSLLQR